MKPSFSGFLAVFYTLEIAGKLILDADMQRKLFFDDALNAEFAKTGFVVLNLLDDSQLNDFLRLNDQLNQDLNTLNRYDNTYELTFFQKDAELKKKKFASYRDFMMPLLGKHLDRYEPLIINYFSKAPGSGEVPVHQNWTFVDERRFTSVSVWCPLQPVSRKNGTLEVVPGTQKVICDVRGPSIEWVFSDIIPELIEKYMVPLELKPGQVAVIDDSVIHYSGVNHSDAPRRAVQFILKPEEAQAIHYFRDASDPPGRVQLYEVGEEFFFDFDMRSRPNGGKLSDTITYLPRQISTAEMEALIAIHS